MMTLATEAMRRPTRTRAIGDPAKMRGLYEPPLDAGIARYVETLAEAGVETYESCEGGPGHTFPEPTVRFHGDRAEGFRALAVLLRRDFPVSDLRRIWRIVDGEPSGPTWEIVFYGVGAVSGPRR